MKKSSNSLSDAIEELEKFSGHVSGDLKAKLDELKPQIEELRSKVHSETKRAKEKVESEVKDHPWAALGIAGLIFFVLGLLFGVQMKRKSD